MTPYDGNNGYESAILSTKSHAKRLMHAEKINIYPVGRMDRGERDGHVIS